MVMVGTFILILFLAQSAHYCQKIRNEFSDSSTVRNSISTMTDHPDSLSSFNTEQRRTVAKNDRFLSFKEKLKLGLTEDQNEEHFLPKKEQEYITFFSRRLISEVDVEPVVLVKLLHHIRYLPIIYPPNLQDIKISRGMNILTIRLTSTAFGELRRKFSSKLVPAVFLQYGVSSSFIANFLDSVFILAGIILFKLLCVTLKKLFIWRSYKRTQYFFERIGVISSNLIIIFLISNLGDIILYASLEFRSIDFDEAKSIVSFIVCILTCILVLLLYGAIFFLIHRLRQKKKKIVALPTLKALKNFEEQEFESFQVVFQGIKTETIFSQAFFLIYGIRLALPMTVASFLYEYPRTQTIAYTSISAVIITFLVVIRPIKETLDLINLVLIEIIILVIHASALSLTIFDTSSSDYIDALLFYGNAVVIGNIILFFLSPFFMILKILQTIRHAFYLRKEKSPLETSVWFQILLFPLQKGGLGFEQIQILPPSNEEKSNISIIASKSENHFMTVNQSYANGTLENHDNQTIDNSFGNHQELENHGLQTIKDLRRKFSQDRGRNPQDFETIDNQSPSTVQDFESFDMLTESLNHRLKNLSLYVPNESSINEDQQNKNNQKGDQKEASKGSSGNKKANSLKSSLKIRDQTVFESELKRQRKSKLTNQVRIDLPPSSQIEKNLS